MQDDVSAPPAGAPARAWIRFSEAIATVICERISEGETLMGVCRDTDLPCRATVQDWARRRPGFRERLAQAFRAGRHAPRGGRRSVWHPQVAALILKRLALGMSLPQALDLPGLPCEATVYGWVQERPEFRAAYGRARTWQAHRRFDQVWEIAEAATPATVTVARLQIGAAQWQASRLAPKRYGGRGDGGEMEAAPEVRTVRLMRFGLEPGEADYEDVPFMPPGWAADRSADRASP